MGDTIEEMHKVKQVWCNDCESWHVECMYGCCYPSKDGTVVKGKLINTSV